MFYSPFDNTAKELGKLKQEMSQDLYFEGDKTCEYCKTRLSDIKETGYVGCSKCYKTFRSDLLNILYNFHKSVEHTGARPQFVATKAKIEKQIEELSAKQISAAQNEDYILAQTIKEQIEKLKGEL